MSARKPSGGGRLIAFGWYGGKFSRLSWLLPLLPECHHFVEPYGGSGAILLNRDPSPLETYNDLDGEIANFFRQLRENRDRLLEALELTPYSREEYEASFLETIVANHIVVGDLERARRFFVRARQTHFALAGSASLGRWAHDRRASRNGVAGVVSRWLGTVEKLPDVATRLLMVQIENRPALECIRIYDSPDTLFYCDPPYVLESRVDRHCYTFELEDGGHVDLASILHSIQGKAAVSGYRGWLMDELYHDWERHDAPEVQVHTAKAPRLESLWTSWRAAG